MLSTLKLYILNNYILSILIPLLLEVSSATASVPSIISSSAAATAISALLEFPPLFAIPAAVTVLLLRSECFYIRCIGRGELSISDPREFTLNGIVMHDLLMPVIISKFHIICDCIGISKFLVRVLFFQRLVDDHFQVLAQVREFGIPLGVRQRLRLSFKCFPRRDGVW